VKINRLELIEKIRAMIAERESKALERKIKAYDEAGSAETNYVKDHAGDWGKFADTIRRRNRNGQAITVKDVPEGLRSNRGFGGNVDFFQPVKVKDSDYVAYTGTLTNLLAVLETSPDEFVSTSALDRIGAPLRELMK
jgi:hypothetical protein